MKRKHIIKVVLILLVSELCLGGGGRFTAWGFVSLRMILFALALILTGIILLDKRERAQIANEYWTLLIFFTLIIMVGLATGLTHGADSKFWKEDVKPLSYFLILPFFLIAIKDVGDIRLISKIIMGSAVIMAVTFLILLISIHSQTIPFLAFYKATIHTEELFFRGEFTFFYKGFLYLGIGIIFFYFLADDKPVKYFIISLLAIALVCSLTRGMMMALLLTFTCHLFLKKSWIRLALPALLALVILWKGGAMITQLSLWLDANKEIMFTHTPSVERSGDMLLGDRSYSDGQRIIQVKEVFQSVSFSSAWVGHGFGIGVPYRPVHMEISYLEIFHKQGIVGLVFWCVLLWMIWKRYQPVAESPYAKAFFFSAVFIFLQSFTNQYINNPIGLSMLLLSLVCLDRLKQAATQYE